MVSFFKLPPYRKSDLSIQTSIGTGYDLQNSVFSPDGRNFQVELPSSSYRRCKLIFLPQVEYAVKAVENGGTCVGIRCKDGVVLAVEKIITSKLLKPGANKRISTVDRNLGVVCGLVNQINLVTLGVLILLSGVLRSYSRRSTFYFKSSR